MVQNPCEEVFVPGNNVIPWERFDEYSDDYFDQEMGAEVVPVDSCNAPAPKLSSDVMYTPQDIGLLCRGGYLADDADSVASSESSVAQGVFPFLSLPPEIRIEIYKLVHLMTPVRQAHLTPWYPTPVYSTYFLRRLQKPTAKNSDSETNDNNNSNNDDTGNPSSSSSSPSPRSPPEPDLLSPHRPLAGMPTALLTVNRQIYHEARELPFECNEFVFINWFASGLWAARSFVKGMAPWQRAAMRYVRLELLARDLTGAHADEWAQLCRFWRPSLRGMRLKILSGGGAFGSWVANGIPRKGSVAAAVWDADGRPAGWAGPAGGLAMLRGLRWLEVELLVTEWDADAKMAWCAELEGVLNRARDEAGVGERVSVVSVEREACGEA